MKKVEGIKEAQSTLIRSQKILYSENFGEMYCDIQTKQVRHRFPVDVRLVNEFREDLCVLDMSTDDVVENHLILGSKEDFTIRIPLQSVSISFAGNHNYGDKLLPHYVVQHS